MNINLNIGKKGILVSLLLGASISFGSGFVSIISGNYEEVVAIPEVNEPKIGTVMMWLTETPPNGWLELNGQTTTGHPELASLVGSNVPDFRGEHIRAFDNGKGIDSARTLLSIQSDQVKSHNHDIIRSVGVNNGIVMAKQVVNEVGNNGVFSYYKYGRGEQYSTPSESDVTKAIGKYLGNSMAAENRIRNVSVMYIIKAE